MTEKETREQMIEDILCESDWFRKEQLESMSNAELNNILCEIYGF